jgi:transcriptional regulator with XRE-family HTH domain
MAEPNEPGGETMAERMQRMRTGSEEPLPEPEAEESAERAPRVSRREPPRKVRERAAREEAAARAEEPRASPEAQDRARPDERRERTHEVDRGSQAPPGPPEQELEPDTVVGRLADRLAVLRAERGWSLHDLSERTGVSRSNLSRIERGQVSPTAAVLMRLAHAYGLLLSGLLAEVESQPRSLVRAAEQSVTGEDAWRRRVVSPPFPGLAGSVTDAQLLPGTDVTYDPPLAGAEQHLWLITGMLELTLAAGEPGAGAPTGPGEEKDPEVRAEKEGDFVLVRGDCLRLRLWGPARLRCLSPDPARYALFTVAS